MPSGLESQRVFCFLVIASLVFRSLRDSGRLQGLPTRGERIMRMSKLFSQTLRDAPSDTEIPSHKLLVRAGYIRQLAAGIFTAMPLAKRSLTKL